MTATRTIGRIDNRWLMLAILFVARFALGFQFQGAGSVTPVLLSEFGTDYTGLGTLVGLFMVPGIFFAIPSGFLSQRFADKQVVLFSLLTLAVGGAISGFAGDYLMIAIGRAVSGAGAAFLFIILTKMLADWFADKELFLGMAIFIIGWPVGIAAGQALQPAIAAGLGWRAVFLTTVILSLVASALIATFYRSPPNIQNAVRGKMNMLSRPEFILVTIAGLAWMFVNGAYLVMVSFGPVLLDEQSVPFADAAQITSLMSWVFFFALPVGGYIATRYGIPKTVLTIGFGGTVIVGAAIPYTDAPFITFTLFGILYAAAVPILGAMPALILRPERRAAGMGIYYVWYFVGCALLPVIAGYLNDATSSATAPVLFATAMMLATLVLAFIVYWAQHVWTGKMEQAAD